MTRSLTFKQASLLALICQPWDSVAVQSRPRAYSQQQQHLGLDIDISNVYLRPATEMDLDDITTVILDAFAPSQLYQYAFPQFNQFKQYHWNCMREDLGRQFAHIPKGNFVNVISVSTSHNAVDSEDRRRQRVVAVAAWKTIEPHTTSGRHRDLGMLGIYDSMARCSDHLDTNMTRAVDFARQFSLVENHFVHDYPHEQMYLALLATHPDWDGHGFGAMHCHWGMEKAKGLDMPNTLIASPAGWPLYDSLGFESLANITIKTLDWPEDLWYEYMRYEN